MMNLNAAAASATRDGVIEEPDNTRLSVMVAMMMNDVERHVADDVAGRVLDG